MKEGMTMKKVLGIILVFCMLLSLCPAAFAAEYEYEVDGIYFTDLKNDMENTGKNCVINVEVTKKSGLVGNHSLLIAAYSADNELINFHESIITMQNGEEELFSIPMFFPGDKEVELVKAFIWNNLQEMCAMSTSFEKTYSDDIVTSTSTKYAIATKILSDGSLQMVLADGTSEEYEMTSSCAREINLEVAEATANEYITLKDYLNDSTVGVEGRVITYTLMRSENKIADVDLAVGTYIQGEYKLRTGRLASVEILSTTQVIDAIEVEKGALANIASNYGAFAVDSFRDGKTYSAIAFITGRDASFVVLTAAAVFDSKSRFAVVQKGASYAYTPDDYEADAVTVLYGGSTSQILFFEPELYADAGLGVGDAFFFETDSDGIIDKVYPIYKMGTDKVISLTDAGVQDEYITAGSKGWSYNLWDEGKDIQLVSGYIVDVNSDEITLTTTTAVDNGLIDTSVDIDDADGHTEGVATFYIDWDCVAYEYDAFNDDLVSVSNRFSAKNPSSLKASDFEKYESAGNRGVYKGTLIDDANFAVVMIVDGDIVAIYTIPKY